MFSGKANSVALYALFYKAGAKKRAKLYDAFLIVVTDKLLPERPYRYEPRLKKRRPKPYGWMQQPRDVLSS